MRVYKPMLLGLSTRPVEHRKRFGLCISALLHFPFTEEAVATPTLWTEMSLWPFLAREMPQGPLIDEGVAKLTPEFLVHGHAFAPPGPDGRPATRCAVRASLGGVVKTLAVSGERVWVDGRATTPQPFERMPLSWENAYGGADFAANPLGKGRRSAEASPVRLPNVEDLRHPVTAPDSVPPPAGFGRIDPTWPQRARLRGTYDEAWYKDHAPGFAPDLDWRHFNLAPADQWMPAPLVGDEPFTLEHMHATRRRIDGRLPGFRARCFAQYRAARAGDPQALREVPLRLTTVWFFPHAERGVLVFQGMADISEDDGSDITGLMGAVERLGEVRDDGHYADAWERRQDPVSGGLQSLREGDLLPAGLSSIDPDFEATKASLKVDGLQAQAQLRRAALVVDEARADALAQGLDPDALGIRMPPPEEAPTLENLADYVAEKNALAQQALRQDMERAARQIREAEEEAEREGVAFPVQGRRGPPVYSAADHMKELLAAPGVPGETAEAAQARHAALDTLAPRLARLEGAQRLGYLQGAHMQAPAPRLPADAAGRLRAQVAALHANRRLSLAGLDFTGADLSGLDLRGADLSEAWLESADLRGANLSGAVLARAVLSHADLGGTIAIGTDFSGANLGGALFENAVLDGANLAGAMLMHAQLGNVHLRGARLAGANLLNSHWGAADCTDAEAEQQNFIQLDLGATTWAGARLNRANFLQCRLEGADFGGAQLASANFAGCGARGVRMAGALLAGASFVERCELTGIDLQQARCDGANFGETAMAGARLRGASLKGANLRLADLSDADLRRAVAIGALMTRTRLPRAQAQGANLMNAVLQNANLRGADLSHANLHGADLTRVRLDADTRIDGALITRTRIHPRLTPAQQAQYTAADAAGEAAR